MCDIDNKCNTYLAPVPSANNNNNNSNNNNNNNNNKNNNNNNNIFIIITNYNTVKTVLKRYMYCKRWLDNAAIMS